MLELCRDFLPADLRQELSRCGIDRTVAVQARQTVRETRWLLNLARDSAFIAGVVGWVPLAAPQVGALLDELAADPKLRGVRHVIQDEPDNDFILRDDFNRGVRALKSRGLAYDILIFERHLPQAIQFVDRHPSQIFILDHIAKPRIYDKIVSPWRENILELSERGNVYCKLSGIVTEAAPRQWQEAELDPYIDTVLEAFGPRRLMFGSDWPVCLPAATYQEWFSLVRRKISSLSEAEQERILGGTAREAYGLGESG
jgi:L-fuconolactonase